MTIMQDLSVIRIEICQCLPQTATVSVADQEIVFRFYTHVAANSDNETVRKYAEILAKEELGHAALLRAERRYTYHA